MNTHLDRARQLGLIAALLTAVAGVIEIVTGSNSWTGDKSEPTTLGLLTIVLAAVMAITVWMGDRSPTTRSSLAVAAGLAVPAAISVTTAGRLAIPGALVGAVAGAVAATDARQRGSLRHTIVAAWPLVLIAVLAGIYLAFGAVAGPIGLLGIVGAVAAIAALVVRHRSQRLAVVLLIAGVVPFALAAWWSVVIPLTAVLLLAIEIPQLLDDRLPTPAPTAAHQP